MMDMDTNFLSHRNSDAVDMCIGTCDVELDLHLSVNQTDEARTKFNQFYLFKDKNDATAILNSYSFSDPFFSDLSRNELLESVEITDSKIGNEIGGPSFDLSTSTSECFSVAEDSKIGADKDLIISDNIDTKTLLSLPECKDNFTWENLSVSSNQSYEDLIHLISSVDAETNITKISDGCEKESNSDEILNNNCDISSFVNNNAKPLNAEGEQIVLESKTGTELNSEKTFFSENAILGCEKESKASPVLLITNLKDEPKTPRPVSTLSAEESIVLVSSCKQESIISNNSNVVNISTACQNNQVFLISKDKHLLKVPNGTVLPVTVPKSEVPASANSEIYRNNGTPNLNCEIFLTERLPAKLKIINQDPSAQASSTLVSGSLSQITRQQVRIYQPTSNKSTSIVSNSRSLLKTSANNISEKPIAPKTKKSKSVNETSNKQSMAFVSISTNKVRNTTEIIINTPQGQQVFQGKTTDLMEATSNLWQKIDTGDQTANKKALAVNKTQNPKSKLKRGNVVTINGLKSIDKISKNGEDGEQNQSDADEQPISDALAKLGILTDGIVCITSKYGQRTWVCPIPDCKKTFTRQSILKIHILGHYGVRPFKCDFPGCTWSFFTLFKLKRHKETHSKRKDFVCQWEGCERRFTTIYNLNTHAKIHERPAEEVCLVCGELFQTKRNLEIHMKIHDREHAPYVCTHNGCGKQYYTINSLTSHRRKHLHNEEELICTWEGCGKQFDKPCRLKSHMRLHTGDKPYVCNYEGCRWAFCTASKLKRHEKKHTNDRKFACTVLGCGKSFMRSEHLREHAFTHQKDKVFQCPVESCKVKFSAKSTLYVHVKKHFSKETLGQDKMKFSCPIEDCTQKFSTRIDLQDHLLKNHSSCLAPDYVVALFSGEYDPNVREELPVFASETLQTISEEHMSVAVLPPSSSHFMSAVDLATSPTGISSLVNPHTDFSSSTASICNTNGQQCTPEDLSCANGSLSSDGTTEESVYGSARTSYTYEDIRREKKNKENAQTASEQFRIDPNNTSPSSAGCGQDMSGYLLQDFLQPNNRMYDRYHGSTLGHGIGEFRVLLLDPSSSGQEFSESTINLRDLE